MSVFTIYHNPRCSKSRQTLALLEEQQVSVNIIEYLKTPPSAATLLALSAALDKPLAGMLRNKEDEYKALALKTFSGSEQELADIVAQHPKLLERPIVVREDTNNARIGRPPESILELL